MAAGAGGGGRGAEREGKKGGSREICFISKYICVHKTTVTGNLVP